MIFSEKDIMSNVLGLKLKIVEEIIDQIGSNCKEKYFKFVGHVLDDSLSWVGHVEHLCKKLSSSNYAINSTKHFLPKKVRLTINMPHNTVMKLIAHEIASAAENKFMKCIHFPIST